MVTFKNYQEAEKYLEEKYLGKIVQFTYWHKYKQKYLEKTKKVDRLSVEPSRDEIILFFTDGTKNEFHKDFFFKDVKLIN